MNASLLKKLFVLNLAETILRFPFSVLMAVLFTIFSFIELNDIDIGQRLDPWLYVLLAASFFAYTSLKLVYENSKVSLTLYSLLLIVVTVFLLSFGILQDAYSLSFLLLGSITFTLVAPFLINDQGDIASCNFNTALAASAFFAILSAVILCIGVSSIITTVDFLFGTSVSIEMHANIWLIGLALFAPLYALPRIPEESDLNEKHYPASVATIFVYILAPLIAVYFGVLYAYMLKILVEWDLPKGSIAYLVVSFGIIGVFWHIFSYPIKDGGTAFFRFLYRYFYLAFLPPLLLLCLGIGVRILDYGFTEQRYLILIFTVWFILATAYVLLIKEPRFKNIILVISGLLILSSFGFWGAGSVSERSQVSRLETLLEKHNLLADGKIIPTAQKIESRDIERMQSILQYLSDTGKLQDVRNWFPASSYIRTTKDPEPDASLVLEDLGLDLLAESSRAPTGKSFYIQSIDKRSKRALLYDTQHTDFFVDVAYTLPQSAVKWSESVVLPTSPQQKLTIEQPLPGIFDVSIEGKKPIVSLDLKAVIESLVREGYLTGPLPASRQKDLIIKGKNRHFSVDLHIDTVGGHIVAGEPSLTHASFKLAISLN